MKKSEVYHISFEEGLSAWKVEKEGFAGMITRTAIKDAAVRAAKSLARSAAHGRVIIHRKNGQIQEEISYGRDPLAGLA